MGRPATIDRDAVLAAALAVCDRSGVAGLSIGAVAAEAGVSPMALYRYVPGKDGLIDGVVELLLLQIADGVDDAGSAAFPELLRRSLSSAMTVATAHPDAFPLLLSRPVTTPAGLSVCAGVQDALRRAGVAEERVVMVERMVSSSILSVAAGYATRRFSTDRTAADLDLATAFVLGGVRQVLGDERRDRSGVSGCLRQQRASASTIHAPSTR